MHSDDCKYVAPALGNLDREAIDLDRSDRADRNDCSHAGFCRP
jgi:hypothetical protein